jgi:hypothetical protein
MNHRFWCGFLGSLLLISQSVPSYAAWGENGNYICKAVQRQDQPNVSGSGGNVVITWRDFRSGNGDGDIYAQEVTANGQPLWPVGNPNQDQGMKICDNASRQSSPRAIRFGEGLPNGPFTWIVWIDERDGGPRIYAEKVDNNGPKFGNGKRACKTESDQTEFDVTQWITAEEAGIVVVWKDSRNNATTGKDIYAQRLGKDGELLWGDDGKEVCKAAGDQSKPRASRFGSEVFVAWEDRRNGADDTDIFAQKMDYDGARKWNAADGVVVCNVAGHQQAIALECPANLIVVWQDRRPEAADSLDIYAQSLNTDNGGRQWLPDDGVGVCIAAKRQRTPQLVGYDRGAYIAWRDERDGSNGIRAQRVDINGAIKWTAGGIRVADTPFLEDKYSFSLLGMEGDLVSTSNWIGNAEKISALRFGPDGKYKDDKPVCISGFDEKKYAIYQATGVVSGKGVLVAWTDEKRGTNNSDIVARWVPLGKVDDKKIEQKPAPRRGAPSIAQLTLVQNRPNPFRHSTEFRVGLPDAGPVTLEVFDVSGRRVWEQQIEGLAAGWHSIPFDGRDQSGRNLPSGVYFCRVSALDLSQRMKIVIQR